MTDLSKLEELFHAARALTEGPEREAFLEQACAKDQALRARLETLLRLDVDSPDLVDTPDEAPPVEGPGQWIGRYKLLEKIGEGGFGSVWMAEQHEPVQRRVALKVIKLGMDTTQVIARFEAERQALAMMDHPNIAKVFDAGATATGRPYFVMELVSGVTLLEYCDGHRLDTRERLELFTTVCSAIQHAHHKGIIHRDIKPTNVLVTLHDGAPVPKVIDFGIAKATNQELTAKTLFTGHHQIIGTPAYMSPEQAARSTGDIDTRSDIYSLGVLLYELLTGTTPFSIQALLDEGYEAMMRTIREVDPDKPSSRVSTMGDTGSESAVQRQTDVRKLGSLLRGDLDWIVMKSLEKARSRRYGTASELAADIQRHLTDEPVEARPPSGTYRFGKFVRRHSLAVTAASAVGLAILCGTLLATLGYVAAAESAEEARAAQRQSEGERLGAIAASLVDDDPSLALVLAREGGLLSPGIATRSALLDALADPLELATLSGHDAYVFDAQFDPSGKRLLTVAQEPVALIWDVASRRASLRLNEHSRALTSGSFDESGSRVLTSSMDGTACLFDARSGALSMRFDEHGGVVHRARFSPNGQQIVTACEDGVVRVFDVTSSHPARSFSGHESDVLDAIWLPDGRSVASISFDGTVRGWSLDAEEQLFTIPAQIRGTVHKLTYSSPFLELSNEGRRLNVMRAAQGKAGGHLSFDLETRELVAPAGLPDARILAFSKETGRVAIMTNVENGMTTVEVWDAEGESMSWQDTRRGVPHARFLGTEGRYIALWRAIGTDFEVVDLEEQEVIARCKGHRYAILSLAMSRDGRHVVSTSADSIVRLWDLDRARRRDVLRRSEWLPTNPWVAHLTREHPRVVMSSRQRGEGIPTPLVIDLTNGETVHEVQLQRGAPERVLDLASAVDRLVVLESDQRAVVIDLTTNVICGSVEIEQGQIRFAYASPDGTHLAVRIDDGDSVRIGVYEVSSGRLIGSPCQLPIQSGRFYCTNDGTSLITSHGAALPVLIVWDVSTGRELRRCVGHSGHIVDMVMTPDGELAASRAQDGSLIVWNVATATVRAVCRGIPMSSGSRLAMSDDGRFVVAFTNEAIILFDATNGERLALGSRPIEDGWLLPGRFSASGDEIVTPDSERRIWHWPVDPLAASESLVPREASPSEVERFRIGSPAERDARVQAWAFSHESSRALCAWGQRCLTKGDLELAFAAFERAVELRESSPEGHLGKALVHARRAEDTENGSERATQIDQGLAELERALEYAASGRVYSAADSRLDILRADPRCTAILARYGR
jgi:eukaryotic-like serine/threonine-protein kinase